MCARERGNCSPKRNKAEMERRRRQEAAAKGTKIGGAGWLAGMRDFAARLLLQKNMCAGCQSNLGGARETTTREKRGHERRRKEATNLTSLAKMSVNLGAFRGKERKKKKREREAPRVCACSYVLQRRS